MDIANFGIPCQREYPNFMSSDNFNQNNPYNHVMWGIQSKEALQPWPFTWFLIFAAANKPGNSTTSVTLKKGRRSVLKSVANSVSAFNKTKKRAAMKRASAILRSQRPRIGKKTKKDWAQWWYKLSMRGRAPGLGRGMGAFNNDSLGWRICCERWLSSNIKFLRDNCIRKKKFSLPLCFLNKFV